MYKKKINWYLLKYKTNKQNIALLNLKRQGFKIFFPTMEVTRRVNAQFKNEIIPLFPGYLFIAFDLKNDNWNSVNSTFGVSKIICSGNLPSKVPMSIINALKNRCDENHKIVTSNQIKKGDSVKVIKGSFSGFVGTIEKINSKNRIMILLRFMETKSKLFINIDNLELNDNP